MDIMYEDYSRIYYGTQLRFWTIRRNGVTWIAEDGEIEFDAKISDPTGASDPDYCHVGWGNGGSGMDWEWFDEHPEEHQYLFLDPERGLYNNPFPTPYWKEGRPVKNRTAMSEEEWQQYQQDWWTDEAKEYNRRLTEFYAMPDENKPGYNLWEHIHGEEADVFINHWLMQLPADEVIDPEGEAHEG